MNDGQDGDEDRRSTVKTKRVVDLDALSDFGRRAQELTDSLTAPSRAISEAFQRIQDSLPKIDLSTLVAPSPELADIAAQINRQEGLLAGMRTPADMGLESSHRNLQLPELPPNPIFETNERLERIEKQFESMQEVAVQGAGIATSLQAYAADFLSKFEKAANDTEKSANKAVLVSSVAIVLTVVTAAVPVVYDIWIKGPAELAASSDGVAAVAALQAEVAGLKAELAGVQAAQSQAGAEIANAMRTGDAEIVDVLRDIRALLEPRPVSSASPETSPDPGGQGSPGSP